MIPSWLLPDTITVQRATGTGTTFADPVYAADKITLRARVEQRQRRRLTANGIETVNVTVVATREPMGAFDRIWVGDADTSKTSEARTPVGIKSASAGAFTLTETDLG